jgi:hypothetical protein
MDSETFTQADVNLLFAKRIPYTTLRSWDSQGLFQSYEGEEDARGKQKIYKRVNLYQIALCEVLVRKVKVSPKNIADLMRSLFFIDEKDEATIINKFDGFLLVRYSDNLFAATMTKDELKHDKIINPFYFSILTFVINLELLKKSIDDDIKNKLK